MKILLVDADSKDGFPNLALMKISAYHKRKGDAIFIHKGILPTSTNLFDFIYISTIFEENREKIKALSDDLERARVPHIIGGTGWDIDRKLILSIEHIMPDYSLYNTDYSMGFTSRGCLRKCPWCVVPDKEGKIHTHALMTEFHHPDHKKIILLDNNFLASPKWKENFEYLIDNKLRVNFNSGFDIRLVNEENAQYIRETKIRDWRFKGTKYTFAFDQPSHKEQVKRGIDLLRDAGINLHRDNCIFYVLVGYNTTPEQDLERVHWLVNQGVGPFIMRYNKTVGPDRILLHMSRWVNRKYYQFVDFADYDYSDSQECYKAHFKGDCPQRVWSKGK